MCLFNFLLFCNSFKRTNSNKKYIPQLSSLAVLFGNALACLLENLRTYLRTWLGHVLKMTQKFLWKKILVPESFEDKKMGSNQLLRTQRPICIYLFTENHGNRDFLEWILWSVKVRRFGIFDKDMPILSKKTPTKRTCFWSSTKTVWPIKLLWLTL